MKNKWLWTVLATVFIGSIAAGWYFYRKPSQELSRRQAEKSHLEMAQKYYEKNDYVNAIRCINKIESLYPDQQSFVKDYPDSVGCIQLLAQCYHDLKQYERARQYFTQVLNIVIKRYGKNHFSVATAYYGLGKLSLDKKLPDEAIDFFQQSKQVFNANPPKDTFYVARIFWGIAQAYDQKKDYHEAIGYAKKSLAVMADKPIPEQQQKLNSAIRRWEQLLIAP